MQAVGLEATLARLYREGALQKLIVVAIDAVDRMDTYGLSDRPQARSIVIPSRFGAIGTHAHEYSAWITGRLVPYIDANYRTDPTPQARAVLGWSLGALNAFSIAWQYPETFGTLGAFSPSFWVAADNSSAKTIQKTRLVHRIVDGSARRPGMRMWFSVGTAEETDDRDGDGIIDAIDDVQDVIVGYKAADGFATRGLVQLGYSSNLDYAQRKTRGDDIVLYLLQGGQHNQSSWARMLSEFLLWAFPNQ
jgi:S-formylglutathione hydrolase FrmB